MIKKLLPSLLKLKDSLQTGQRADFHINNMIELFKDVTEPFTLSEMESKLLMEIAPNLVTPLCIPLVFKFFEFVIYKSFDIIEIMLDSLGLAATRNKNIFNNIFGRENVEELPIPKIIEMNEFEMINQMARSMLLQENTVKLF